MFSAPSHPNLNGETGRRTSDDDSHFLGLPPCEEPPIAAGSSPTAPSPVGGQAVIEGVMMRGASRWAVVVRRLDGTVEVKEGPHRPWAKQRPILGKPFLRGSVVLLESMIMGIKALNFSAEIAAQDEKKASKPPLPDEKGGAVPSAFAQAEQKAIGFGALALTLGAAFALAIFLFVALPHVLSILAGRLWGFSEASTLFHLIDGLLKFGFFITYVWAIGLIDDIGRVYSYHGAEHQAIYTFEANEPLTVEMAAKHSRFHPRCGTAFIFLVLALSILFFAAIFPLFFSNGNGGLARTVGGIILKIILMFPLAGLAYELTRLAANRHSHWFWRVILWPGILLQRLTTRKPDNSQLEVALMALKKVVAPN
ncbi:MAG: DUF1385 domain-containing protein [Candidatus Adiutrix sp.]